MNVKQLASITRLFYKAGKPEILLDVLVSATFTVSLAEALFRFRGLDGPLWLTIISSLLLSAAIAAAARNWWSAPLFLLTPLLLTAYILWRLEVLEPVLQYLAGFASWCLSWLQAGLPEAPEPYWPAWLRILLLLLLAAALQLLVRRVSNLVVYAILLLIVFLPMLIWFPDTLPALLIGLAGLILLLPRHFVRLVEKERPQESRLPRMPMQLLAIPIAIISLLTAQSAVPASTWNWRLPAIINQISDVQDIWQTRFGQSRAWQAFNIADFGFQTAGSRLGGPVLLNKKTVLKVKASQPVLLKGTNRMFYNGSSWERAPLQQYRFHSNLWWQIRQRAFDRGLPGGAAGQSFRTSFSRQLRLVIEPQLANQSTLFAAGRVKQISLDNMLDFPPYFTTAGELFVYGGLPRNHQYTIEADYLDRSLPGFDAALLAIEATAASSPDSNWAAISADYLQLPAGLPAEVTATAVTAAGFARSPYQKALYLQQFFQTGFTYSLTPDLPPEQTDFVAHFLQSRIGYCVYFATAMTVMARSLGIPARYAEGFILQQETGTTAPDQWQAAGNTAHAWVELYFQGIGWLSFDPTPGLTIVDPSDPGLPAVVTPTMPPTPTPVAIITPEPTPALPEQPSAGRFWYWLLPLIFLLPLLLKLGLSLACHQHRQQYRRDVVAKKLPAPADQLEYYYHDLLRQLTCLGIQPEPAETLTLFADRADHYLRLGEITLPDVLWPVICWRYGGRQPHEADLQRFAEFHSRLEKRLQETMGRLAYLFRRVLAPKTMPGQNEAGNQDHDQDS